MQLYSQGEKPQRELDKLFSSYENGQKQPTQISLFDTFRKMMGYFERVQIVIGALDECCKTRSDLLSWMESLSGFEHAGLHLLATSRKEKNIERELERWLHQESRIPIQKAPVNVDIRAYVHERLRNGRGFERWHSDPSVQEEVETELMKKADRI